LGLFAGLVQDVNAAIFVDAAEAFDIAGFLDFIPLHEGRVGAVEKSAAGVVEARVVGDLPGFFGRVVGEEVDPVGDSYPVGVCPPEKSAQCKEQDDIESPAGSALHGNFSIAFIE
jgi:hypothetical protein